MQISQEIGRKWKRENKGYLDRRQATHSEKWGTVVRLGTEKVWK